MRKSHIIIYYLLFVITFFLFSSCNGCSNAQLHRARKTNEEESKSITKKIDRETKTKSKTRRTSNGRTVVKMTKKNGVYTVPIEINGAKMFFIFDTGASYVSLSETEANFLIKQGTLTRDDIIGTSQFSDANGDVSEGTIINLKTVKIGNRVINNVRASVVHNAVAPLLLGQSVLNKFGKVSIDYNKEIIIFE